MTFSILPDFLHPGKRHTQRFVSSVFDFVLSENNTLKRAGSQYGIYPPTIRKWINNLSSDRQGKASLFCPQHFRDDIFESQPMVFASALWETLKSMYGNALIDATKQIYARRRIRLY